MNNTPEGGPIRAVVEDTANAPQGGPAMRVYGYLAGDEDRPVEGGPAIPVKILTDADLVENGGAYTVEGRIHPVPVTLATDGRPTMGMRPIPVYPVNAWPSVPFSPSDIANLDLWIGTRFETGLVNNDPIPAFHDQSANGYLIEQETAGSRALYKPGVLNGLPVARFDGGNDWYTGGDILDYTAAFTWFMVAQFADDGAMYSMLFTKSFGENNNTQYELRQDDTNPRVSIVSSINGANAQAIHSSDFDLLQWNIISGVAVAATGVSHYLATTANGTGAWSPSGSFANTVSEFQLGTRIDGQHPFPGDFAELLIYGRALTNDERAQVVTYLQGIYAL